jgi:hypothetical protein
MGDRVVVAVFGSVPAVLASRIARAVTDFYPDAVVLPSEENPPLPTRVLMRIAVPEDDPHGR